MKTLIITALATAAFAGFGGRLEARDRCGGGHHHHSSHHYGGHHYGGSCSSFGIGFGSPFYYSRPVYSYSYSPFYYPGSSGYYGRSYGYYPSARRSSTGVDVQVALARRGYYHGNIDGVIGPMSRSAIRRYQASRGLRVTGVIDYPLLRTLGIA